MKKEHSQQQADKVENEMFECEDASRKQHHWLQGDDGDRAQDLWRRHSSSPELLWRSRMRRLPKVVWRSFAQTDVSGTQSG